MSQDLDFTVEAGKPLTIHVKARGKRYVLRLANAVHFVRDTGEDGKNGEPLFAVSITGAVQAERVVEEGSVP